MASEEKKESQTFEKRATNSYSPFLEGEASNQSEKGFDRWTVMKFVWKQGNNYYLSSVSLCFEAQFSLVLPAQ